MAYSKGGERIMFIDRAELDPRPVFICDWCGRTIYEAEYYYYLDHGDTVVCGIVLQIARR